MYDDMTASGWGIAPTPRLMSAHRHRKNAERHAPHIPANVREMVVMLLAETRWGREQLFATADALREARREALAAADPIMADEFRHLAVMLESQAEHRPQTTDWSRAA